MQQRISHMNEIPLRIAKITNGVVIPHQQEWLSEKLSRVVALSMILEANTVSWINQLKIKTHSKYPQLFPKDFRFEYSENGKHWRILFSENVFKESGSQQQWQFNLIKFKYIKVIAQCSQQLSAKEGYQLAVGKIVVAISGFKKVEASSEFDRLWLKENINDDRMDYGWSTKAYKEKKEDWLCFDLGYSYPIQELRFLSAQEIKNSESLFPRGFKVLSSNDKTNWNLIFAYQNFLSEASTWYVWEFILFYARYIKISISDPNINMAKEYQSKIAEIEVYAISDTNRFFPGATSGQASASTIRAGVVRLAMSGESTEGVVVQGSDRRLQAATKGSKGIVELATDGETKENVVVQGNDQRLSYGTTEKHGILRLSKHGESTAGRVLQSDDPRLQKADENVYGLVKLGRDGEADQMAVARANDCRLNYASSKKAGIVKFAKDQEKGLNLAISSDDSRLLDGTTERSGTTRFAHHDEESANKSVQADDPRLTQATTFKKGIIRLARDGESTENVAVQSNDQRLKPASPETTGIVRLAKNKEKTENLVVCANDERLSDPRLPLPHTHDYAKKEHSFDTHTGTIHLKKNQGKEYQGWASPPSGYAPIIGSNQGEGAGLVGESPKGEGVFGIGKRAGIVGMSVEQGAGVIGLSKNNVGGHFVSENDCSLIAGGTNRGVKGSPYAFLSRGLSAFEDTIFLNYASCLAIAFPKNQNESITRGDAVILKAKNGAVTKVGKYGDTRIIGIVTDKASLVMNIATKDNTDESELKDVPSSDHHLVAVSGIVRAKVTAFPTPIQRGDLLVSANESGYLQKLDPNKYIVGMICARSLENLDKGKDSLRVILICS